VDERNAVPAAVWGTRGGCRVATAPVREGVYLQGGTEKTHGLTASLLSDVAVRAGEVLNSILAHRNISGRLARLGEDNPYATSEVR